MAERLACDEHGRHGDRGSGRPEEGCDDRTSRGRGSCNDRPFHWPSQHDDDEDDDYEHPGQGGQTYSDDYWGITPVRRERSRSPPCWDHGNDRGRRHGSGIANGGNLNAFMPNTTLMNASQLQALFAVRAHDLRSRLHNEVTEHPCSSNPSAPQGDKDAWLADAYEYINKATALAMRLGIVSNEGEQAWSALSPTPAAVNVASAATETPRRKEAEHGGSNWSATIPVKHVFTRLSTTLHPAPPPTIADVEAALTAFALNVAPATTPDCLATKTAAANWSTMTIESPAATVAATVGSALPHMPTAPEPDHGAALALTLTTEEAQELLAGSSG